MAVSKVVYGDETLVDLTDDTVTEDTLAKGVTAHNAAGLAVTGTMTGGGNVLYGDCGTDSSTTTKTVVCPDADELYAGLAIMVVFGDCGLAMSTALNVNGLGAKNIYVNGATTSSSNRFCWSEETEILFIYNGTYWLPIGFNEDWYGTSSTAASTTAKAAKISNYILQKGTRVTVTFTYANTSASPTLNVSSTGAVSITGDTGWEAGETVAFTFDGSQYISERSSGMTATYDADTETLILS